MGTWEEYRLVSDAMRTSTGGHASGTESTLPASPRNPSVSDSPPTICTRDAPQDTFEDAFQDSPQEAPQEVPQGALQDTFQDALQDVPQDVSRDFLRPTDGSRPELERQVDVLGGKSSSRLLCAPPRTDYA